MDASGLRVHQRGEGVEIRGLELGDLPVAKERVDDRVLVAQLLQDVGVGGERSLGGLLERGQTQLLVEDDPELRWGPDVELLPRVPVDLLLQRRHLVPEGFGHLLEVLHVQPDPGRLHPRQDGGQGHLNLGQEPGQSRPLDPLRQDGREECHGGRRSADPA